MSFAPYMLWRRSPFRGTLVNVDADGNRVTPGANCVAGAYTVFMFGGSTLWGTGAPDWSTIPAYVQRGLSERLKRPVCFANFGQTGYVSTQELFALERELQASRLPSLVVFYDGVNDVFAAYHPGWHQNVEIIAEALSPSGSAFARGVHSSSLARLVAPIVPRPTSEAPRDYRATGVSVDSLAQSVTRSYLQVTRMVSALGAQYGFQAVFFWQPMMIVGRKPLTPEEYSIRAGSDPVVGELFTATYRTIEREARDYAGVHYIADALAGERAPVYIDLLHVTPTGNQRITEQMLPVISGR